MKVNLNNSTPISANIRENYSSLDGLRAYAAGIVLMHVQTNLMIKPSDNILTCNVIRKHPTPILVV